MTEQSKSTERRLEIQQPKIEKIHVCRGNGKLTEKDKKLINDFAEELKK